MYPESDNYKLYKHTHGSRKLTQTVTVSHSITLITSDSHKIRKATTEMDESTTSSENYVSNADLVLGTESSRLDERYIMDVWESSPINIIYLIFLSVSTLIGNVGNVLVIGAVLSDRRLRRQEGNIFILNLATADLCVTSKYIFDVW